MHSKLAIAALLSALVAGSAAAFAQTTQGFTTTPALRTDGGLTAAGPVPGSNSFTEGQARGRMEDAGFTNVTDLSKDDQGIWRGRAVRAGSPTGVALDYQGNVFGGAATGSAAGIAPAGPRDGAPGNPPSTALGRATDRVQGETPRPDGAPGNPPGTAAGRAVDRALGGNTPGGAMSR